MRSSELDAVSQLRWLGHDQAECWQLLEDHVTGTWSAISAAQPPRRVYLRLTLDLFCRSLELATGALRLLEHRLMAPLIPVSRALVEATVALAYLSGCDDPETEAEIYEAYGHLKWMQVFPDAAEGVAARNVLLAELSPLSVATAKRRMEGRNGWSGKPFRQMAERTGIKDYDGYAFMAEHSHSRLPGDHLSVFHDAAAIHIHLGHEMTDDDVEWAANHACRMLNWSLNVMWGTFALPRPTLMARNPHKWFSDGADNSDKAPRNKNVQ